MESAVAVRRYGLQFVFYEAAKWSIRWMRFLTLVNELRRMGLVGDEAEEALDLVQPIVGGDEVHVRARPSGQPRLNLRVDVYGVVARNAVDIEFGCTALSISRRKDRNS